MRTGLPRQNRRVIQKARRQRVRLDIENLVQLIDRQMAKLDAVVALQDHPREKVGAAVEFGQPVGRLKRNKAFRLAESVRRNGRAYACDEHGALQI